MLAEQCPVHAVIKMKSAVRLSESRSALFICQMVPPYVYTPLDTLANPIGKIEQSAMC